MDMKNSLRKIEQYWQIIRNLHFHIEQEGEISEEEYALIDKYLKVISQKYKGLIKESSVVDNKTAVVVEIEEEKVESVEVQQKEQEEKRVVVEEIEPKREVFKPAPEKEEVQPIVNVVEEVEEEREVVDSDANSERAAVPPKKESISSYLEQMLDSPDSMPAEPVLFSNKADETKTPSLNEKFKEMRSASEDLNTRIKRATADKISLNNKFEFIRELFANNPIEYANAIQYFDLYGMDAWAKVESEYSERFNWSNKMGVVEKFKSLVGSK